MPADKQKPAVNPKKSVHDDYIVCLEDGKKFKSLKRHLMTHYGLTPEQYREKWGLDASYPMVAPNYAAARSQLAKKMGLGRKRKATLSALPQAHSPTSPSAGALSSGAGFVLGRPLRHVDLVERLLQCDVPIEIVAPVPVAPRMRSRSISRSQTPRAKAARRRVGSVSSCVDLDPAIAQERNALRRLAPARFRLGDNVQCFALQIHICSLLVLRRRSCRAGSERG